MNSLEAEMVLNKLDSIEKRLDKLSESTAKMEANLDHNNKSLDEHIRRTEILEKELDDRVKPLEQNSAMWAGVGKLVAIVATLGSIAAVLLALLR